MGSLYARANFGVAIVSTGYLAGDTAIVLTAGQGAKLPASGTNGFVLTWWNATDYADPGDDPNVERVICTNRATDNLTVTRGQDGTAASAKNIAGKTYKMMVAWGKGEIDQLANLLDSILSGSYIYGGGAGSGNAYTATLSTAPAAYAAGLIVVMKASFQNTGASTLNVNGLGAQNLRAIIGGTKQDLPNNFIVSGSMVEAVYDGADFVITNPSAGQSYFTEQIANLVAVPSVAFTGLVAGALYRVDYNLVQVTSIGVLQVQFNNDTGANYKRASQRINADASATVNDGSTAATFISLSNNTFSVKVGEAMSGSFTFGVNPSSNLKAWLSGAGVGIDSAGLSAICSYAGTYVGANPVTELDMKTSAGTITGTVRLTRIA